MDKLKYVKLENPDGSYSESIPLAVDSDYVDVNGVTLTNALSTKADNSSVSILQSEIESLSSGSPKGTYATTAALVEANPDTGVYIITADGHLYSWIKNGSSAIDLGVYQATAISTSDPIIKNVDEYLWGKNILLTSATNISTSSGRSINVYEPLEAGKTYAFQLVDFTGDNLSTVNVYAWKQDGTYQNLGNLTMDKRQIFYTCSVPFTRFRYYCNFTDSEVNVNEIKFRCWELDTTNLATDFKINRNSGFLDIGGIFKWGGSTNASITLTETLIYDEGTATGYSNYQATVTGNGIGSYFGTESWKSLGTMQSEVFYYKSGYIMFVYLYYENATYKLGLSNSLPNNRWVKVIALCGLHNGIVTNTFNPNTVEYTYIRDDNGTITTKTNTLAKWNQSDEVNKLLQSNHHLPASLYIAASDPNNKITFTLEVTGQTGAWHYHLTKTGGTAYYLISYGDGSATYRSVGNLDCEFDSTANYRQIIVLYRDANTETYKISTRYPKDIGTEVIAYFYDHNGILLNTNCESSIIYTTIVGGVTTSKTYAEWKNRKFEEIDSKIDSVSKTLGRTNRLFATFQKVGVCGDSLSSGYMYNPQTQEATNRIPEYSWTHYAGKMAGMPWLVLGTGGLNVITWETHASYGYKQALESGNKCQAYVIALGVNDSASGTSRYVPLGTPEDITDDTSIPTTTYYQGYAKIIYLLKQINPDAKIFCLTIPNASGLRLDYNTAIKYIAEEYFDTTDNVYLVDMYANYYHEFTDSGNFLPTDKSAITSHYSALGYNYIAGLMTEGINTVMNEHQTDFIDVAFIPYDTNDATSDT